MNKLNPKKFLTKLILSALLLIPFGLLFAQDSPCDCADLNSTNLCNAGYFADYTSANTSTPNPYTPSPALAWNTNGDTYTFCTKYTAPAGVSKIGLLNYVGSNHQVNSGCSFTRGSWSAYASGCSSPVTGGNAQGTNAYEFPVTPGIEYRFCVTLTLTDNQCIDIGSIENYLYTAATTPPSGCSATIGTFSMQLNGSATSNTTSYDLLANETFTITANGDASLPPIGVDGDQSGVGYAAFSCDPTSYTLSDPGKYNTTDMPCFLGFHYSPSMTDENNTNSQVNGLNLASWWFVPLTFDDVCSPLKTSSPCPGGNSTSIGIDTDGDACIATGTPIQINYVTPSCGNCTNPACPIYLTPNGASSPSGTYPNSNHITENAIGPSVVTECHLVTVTSTNQRLGFRQGIFQANNGCATRTYELKATDVNGHCTGSAIPISQEGSYSLIFNPEWDNLPPGDYIICITQTLGVGCDIDYINTGYYLENLPTPPCPSDQTFIELDWTQNNPFIPFPSTTYTCNDGPQTIWKNIEAATIATYGELQAFPGFIMDFVNNSSAPANTSIAVSINGTPYSYYGPSDPGGVLYWGNVSSDPYSVLEPYIPAGSTVTITICDSRVSAQSFPYIIWDYSTGSVLASGTATPSNGNCTTITFTLASPTTSWDIDGSTALITDNNNGSATFDPTALSSGSHTITYTFNNNNGCSITATQNITVGPTTTAPTVTNVNYCQNATAIPLTATGSSLLWYTTATGGTGNASAPTPSTITAGTTSYWVTQTSGGCESPRAQIDVTVTSTETPTISCGASTSSSVQFNWTALTGATSYAITYTVNGGASQNGGSVATPNFSLSSLSPGDVVAITIVTTGTGCYANGSGSCTAQACTSPTITAQPAAHSACEGQPATFSVTATAASGYQWEVSTDGGTIFTPLTNTGVYTGATSASLSISDNTGLDSYQYRVVVEETNASCPTTSTSALLTATTIETPVIGCGTSSLTSVEFTLTNTLTGVTDYNVSYTINSGAPITDNNVSFPYTVSSLNGNDQVDITITPNGTGCYQDGTGQCTANSCTPPSITTQPANTTNCEGESATFSVTETGGNGIYSWEVSNDGINFTTLSDGGIYTGTNSSTLNISDNTGLNSSIYRVVVYEALGSCPSTSNNATLTSLSITSADITCGIAGEDSVEFNWTIPNGATDFDINYSIMGQSTVSVPNYSTNRFGITGLNIGDTVSITVSPNGSGCYSTSTNICFTSCTPPNASFLPTPSKMTTLNTTTTMINSSSNATSYLWDFGDGQTSTDEAPTTQYSDLDTGTYLITLTASNGSCQDVATYYVKIFEDLVYYIPNTFTPYDGNDYNQLFKPVFTSGYDTGGYSMEIFNRWGELVFSTTDINQGWDGKDMRSGKICEDGTYVWKIGFGVKSIDKKEWISGHVNLLR